MGEAVRLRVLSYNVHGLRGDRAALYRTVRSAAPDVVCVQEAPRRVRWRTRCADLARGCDLYFASGGGPAIGNMIMVSQRVRVQRHWSLRFPLTPGRHLRGVAFAECAVGGCRFTLAGTHLSTDPGERAAQADQLALLLAGLTGPVLVGVDLNEPPGGRVWPRLLSPALLEDARAAAGSGTDDPAAARSGTDAPAAARGSGTFPAGAPHSRLDAVLVPAGATVHSYAVPDTEDARRASDHLPVLVELSLTL